MKHSRITDLQAFNANVQLAHWQADTRSNAHKTLGELYEGLQELTDTFAEVVLGINKTVAFDKANILLNPNVTLGELISTGRALVKAIYAECGDDNPDLQNIVADMLKEINHAAYLLKV